MERLDGMSWRQFAALARNLSPLGAVARRAAQLSAEGNGTEEKGKAAAFFMEMRAAGR